jgi:type I restriction-modification system DNA methylase subunit
MQWIAPSERDAATDTLGKRFWEASDQLRANSGLTAPQYGRPVMGLIFLRFAEHSLGEFARAEGQNGGEFHTPACIVRIARMNLAA